MCDARLDKPCMVMSISPGGQNHRTVIAPLNIFMLTSEFESGGFLGRSFSGNGEHFFRYVLVPSLKAR